MHLFGALLVRSHGTSRSCTHRDLETKTATPMDVQTNPFCANGMHLPNGSFVVFGGNNAVGPGGNNDATGSTKNYDPTYQDYNGTYAVRLLTPCDGDVDSDSSCAWVDSPNSGLRMQSGRWYPGAEALGNGSVIIIGMATNPYSTVLMSSPPGVL